MDIEDVKEKILLWDNNLGHKQKRRIHFYSIRNFVLHYDYLPSERDKEKVIGILSAYIEEVEYNAFEYKGFQSFELTEKYLNKLSEVYSSKLGFKTFIKFRFIFVIGVLGDGLLYLFLHDAFDFYCPIVFPILLIYYFYTFFFFARKKKVFGIFY